MEMKRGVFVSIWIEMEVCRHPGTTESVDDFQKRYYDDNDRVIGRVRRSSLMIPSVDTRKDLSENLALGRDSAGQGAGSSAILGRTVAWSICWG